MANRILISSAGLGAAINQAQHDVNLNALNSTTETQTGTYEVVYTDHGKLIELNKSSMVCTLDAVADIVAAMDTGIDDFHVTLKNINATTASIVRSSTDTIDGATSLTLVKNESVTLQFNAAGNGWSIVNTKQAVFGGDVDGNNPSGTSVLPTGWSASTPSSGRFTVTHNLGTTNYGVSITIEASSVGYVAVLAGVAANTFTYDVVRTSTDTVTASASARFVLVKI